MNTDFFRGAQASSRACGIPARQGLLLNTYWNWLSAPRCLCGGIIRCFGLELGKFQAVSRPSCRFAAVDLSGAEEDGGQEQDRAGRDEQDAQAGVGLVELYSTEEKAQRNEESCCTETARSPVA